MKPGLFDVSYADPLDTGGFFSYWTRSFIDGGGARSTGDTCSVVHDELAESVIDRKETRLKSLSSLETCCTGANLTCGL